MFLMKRNGSTLSASIWGLLGRSPKSFLILKVLGVHKSFPFWHLLNCRFSLSPQFAGLCPEDWPGLSGIQLFYTRHSHFLWRRSENRVLHLERQQYDWLSTSSVIVSPKKFKFFPIKCSLLLNQRPIEVRHMSKWPIEQGLCTAFTMQKVEKGVLKNQPQKL